MKNNSNNQPLTPSNLFSARHRFNSFNSPFISPLQIIQSPCLNDGNQLDGNFGNAEFNHFQLEDQNDLENEYEQINEDVREEQDQSSLKCPPIPELEQGKDILIDQNNMLEFVLNHINRRDQKIEEARESLQGYSTEFNKRLFDYLTNKFKKLRKTKEEMVKYCVRKSFKFITNKMRAANKEAYINLQNNEVMGEYFQMHCQGDTSISMPFKKNSQQKTMNSNFLKKIFKCRQYNLDYKDFMRQFSEEYNHDNRKKIKSMNQTIKKCCRNKCFKSLEEYKRLPWTMDLLEKIFDFAKQLMEHSPYRREHLQAKKAQNDYAQKNHSNNKKVQRPFHIQPLHPQHPGGHRYEYESSGIQDQFQIIKNVPKKNVIILTPPSRAMNDPCSRKNSLPDIDLLE